jgi:hypothetical protein
MGKYLSNILIYTKSENPLILPFTYQFYLKITQNFFKSLKITHNGIKNNLIIR